MVSVSLNVQHGCLFDLLLLLGALFFLLCFHMCRLTSPPVSNTFRTAEYRTPGVSWVRRSFSGTRLAQLKNPTAGEISPQKCRNGSNHHRSNLSHECATKRVDYLQTSTCTMHNTHQHGPTHNMYQYMQHFNRPRLLNASRDVQG